MAIPVILDTDIGTDIDDTWALAMLLRSPELDPRLIVTSTGDTSYRAQLVAAVLTAAGRGDIPIGIGPATLLPTELPPVLAGRPQGAFAERLSLAEHPGGVRSDGIGAIVECIMESPEPVTLIGIGPMTNIAAALSLEPKIVENARLVAMLGSVRRGELGRSGPEPEYNVLLDVPSCRAALAANWEVTITPLDSCGSIVLRGPRYAMIRRCKDALAEAVICAYDEWGRAIAVEPPAAECMGYRPDSSATESTILFDTMAVFLAYSESLVEVESLPISVEDDGRTLVAEGAPTVRVAVDCQLEMFLDHLTERLVGSPRRDDRIQVGHGRA